MGAGLPHAASVPCASAGCCAFPGPSADPAGQVAALLNLLVSSHLAPGDQINVSAPVFPTPRRHSRASPADTPGPTASHLRGGAGGVRQLPRTKALIRPRLCSQGRVARPYREALPQGEGAQGLGWGVLEPRRGGALEASATLTAWCLLSAGEPASLQWLPGSWQRQEMNSPSRCEARGKGSQRWGAGPGAAELS